MAVLDCAKPALHDDYCGLDDTGLRQGCTRAVQLHRGGAGQGLHRGRGSTGAAAGGWAAQTAIGLRLLHRGRGCWRILGELLVSYFAQPKDLVIEDAPSTLHTSIFGFATHSGCTKSELVDLDYPWYEFVRVLRTSDGMISRYPSKIEKLVHLREMVTLRHLHLTGKRGTLRIEGPGAIYPVSLDNLQTLSTVDAWSCRDFLAGTLNIRKLGIRGCIRKNGLFTFPDTYFLNHLQELKLWCSVVGGPSIRLGGVRFPTNLKKLTLAEFTVKWNEMSTLGKSLPNLEVLKLLQFACVGKCWKTSDGDFPQLKFLKLIAIPIEEWQVSSNHFPRLQRLVLVGCCELQSIPSEIGEVPTLQMIEVRFCNTSVANSCPQNQGRAKAGIGGYLDVVRRITGSASENGLEQA
ncbi:hypothetical protein Acr_23g0013880 [Actinidia rufa]|uniref:Uncharacterized protein n=1 Tax=Actinidia rufa TaxID=165716 RepID=A0A7J0GQE0_9ERIC|nr:hypothetical protein Acr_23g0013880 [Actinidia rufa]